MKSRDADIAAERARIQAAKEQARELKRELLTPLAASKLFKKSPEAVRKAVRNRQVFVEFNLRPSNRIIVLIQLESAMRYWGTQSSHDFEMRLNEMRDNGMTLSVSGLPYNVLHPTPLLTLRDGQDFE